MENRKNKLRKLIITVIILMLILVILIGCNYILNTKKTKTSSTNIVLFNGLDISSNDIELSIPFTKENEEKYQIKYYNYENGEYKGECIGKLETIYDEYAQVTNTNKIAISEKYNAIPRNFKKIDELPNELMDLADYNKLEIESIDLDGDNKEEYVVACGSFASPDDYDVKEYTNYSEVFIMDNNFNKIATLVKSYDQFWEFEGKITEEYFCTLSDVEYIDIDNDNVMEIIVDLKVYEGMGVNVYKYQKGKIEGELDYELSVLP